MNPSGRYTMASGAMLMAALWLLSSCNETSSAARDANNSSGQNAAASTRSMPSGTQFSVSLGGNISSETAHVGDSWHGTVTENVSGTDGGMLPAGSQVDGVIVAVTPAARGSRAMLELGVRKIQVNGHSESVTASSEPVIAGSPRARNLGAIAGGAVAGALIGKAVGDGKNGAVGAIIGGGAAAGVVAGSKGYQVVLPDGAVMSFAINHTVALR